MKNKLLFTLVAIMILCLPISSMAQSSAKPIQIALWHPVQIFDEDTSINGVRISIFYGVNQDVYGLDYGLVNKLKGNIKGSQVGIVNLVEGDMGGIQSGLVNPSRRRRGRPSIWSGEPCG